MKSDYSNNLKLFERASEVIPLASQTFSKSYYSFIKGVSPLFIERARGAYCWDVDNRKFIDYVLGLLPVILGHCNKKVDHAIKKQLKKGILFSVSSELEVILAEKLIELIPCAEMVRFGKNGSDVTTAAIRLARAYTGKNHILVCGYHGWHDWYIGTTARNKGVPQAIQELSHSFKFNDLQSFSDAISGNQNQIAAVIMEPVAGESPADNFLHHIRQICTQENIVLIFDEIVTGFRIHPGGAQSFYNVIPDLSCFGKALGNGMPISALVGKKKIMQAIDSIFFSGTFAGEALSLAAAIETLSELKKKNVAERINNLGEYLIEHISDLITLHSLEDFLTVGGENWWPRFHFKENVDLENALAVSLFRQEMHAEGLLVLGGFNLCLAHDCGPIRSATVNKVDKVFSRLSGFYRSQNSEKYLQGEKIRNVFSVRK